MFVRLEKLDAQRDSLEMEWGRLQLEQSYWSSNAFVERVANAKLLDEPAANPGCADRPAVKQRASESSSELKSYRWRSAVILGLVVCGAVGLGARAVELQLIDHGFLAKQGDAALDARGQDRGASRRHHGSHGRAARRQHAGRQRVGQSAGAQRQHRPAAEARQGAQAGSAAAGAAHHQQSRSRVSLPRAPHAARAGGAHQGAGHSRRVPAARVPALLPRGRGRRARGRIHHPRRPGPGGPGARLRSAC